MEVSIFPKYRELLERYVEVRLDTDPSEARADEYTSLQQQLVGNLARPVYAIVDPEQPERPLATYIGADLPSGRSFADFLRRNAGGGD
jgi:hypothetical protein